MRMTVIVTGDANADDLKEAVAQAYDRAMSNIPDSVPVFVADVEVDVRSRNEAPSPRPKGFYVKVEVTAHAQQDIR